LRGTGIKAGVEPVAAGCRRDGARSVERPVVERGGGQGRQSFAPVAGVIGACLTRQIVTLPHGDVAEDGRGRRQGFAQQQCCQFGDQDADGAAVADGVVQRQPEQMLAAVFDRDQSDPPQRRQAHAERLVLAVADMGQCRGPIGGAGSFQVLVQI
jgi:hypothetical protein